jgi:SulP family sulfate permease
VIAAATVLVALFFVEAIVAHVPRYVTGGLLLYFGINLLKEWLVDTRQRYSPREWWVVVAIVLMVAALGFLTAIIAGFLIATVLFAWSYASVPVIRSQTSLDRLPSSHERADAGMELLSRFGGMVSVFRLQGFLFFGTVERLAEPVRRTVRSGREPALGLILDFTAVTRIDTASATALSRLARDVTERGCRLLLCGMEPGLVDQLRKAGLTGAETAATLDGALEQMEDMILARFGMPAESGALPLADAGLALLLPMMTPRRYEAGGIIIAAGSEPVGLGFLAEGRVAISLPESATQSRHVRTAAAGTLLGDIGFALGIARTADVTAQQDCIVYWLTAEKAAWLEANAPSRAAALNRVISRSLARKVSSANRLTDHLRA